MTHIDSNRPNSSPASSPAFPELAENAATPDGTVVSVDLFPPAPSKVVVDQLAGPSGQPWMPLQRPQIGAVQMQRTLLQAWARERGDVHLVRTVEAHGVNPRIGLSGAVFPTATLLIETTRAVEKCDPGPRDFCVPAFDVVVAENRWVFPEYRPSTLAELGNAMLEAGVVAGIVFDGVALASLARGALSALAPVRNPVPNVAMGDIAQLTRYLDEVGELPEHFSRRGFEQGGRVFRNRNRELIDGHVGDLREVDVGDIRVGRRLEDGSRLETGRGEMRVLYDDAGNIWYTPDHYETFHPIRIGRGRP